MMSSSFSGRGVILCLAVLWVSIAVALDTRGKVQGLVTDTSNAVIAGATVQLRNDNTGGRGSVPNTLDNLWL